MLLLVLLLCVNAVFTTTPRNRMPRPSQRWIGSNQRTAPQVLCPKKQWEAHSRTVGRAYVALVSSMTVYMVGFALVQAVRDNRHLRVRCVVSPAYALSSLPGHCGVSDPQ